MSLRLKFNLVLISVFALGLVASGVISYRMLQRNAQRVVVEQAGLMMEASLAMRGYTVSEIRPLLMPHMSETFLPQTVPAYAATQAFERLRESHREYTYKEATLNPTNPRDRAVAWEADIIHAFRNDPERKELMNVRDTPTGDSLYLARPIQIKNEGCLACHSVPEAAPRSMRALYDDGNGYGWRLNEIVGAQIVSVPMSLPQERAMQTFYTFMGSLLAVFAVIAIALNVMLGRIVIRPVTLMADTADAVSQGNFSQSGFDVRGRDEISLLAKSFQRMERSLEKAMRMLES